MLPVGTLLNNREYRIEEQLRSGGFGNTYKVKRLTFDEIYAMKEFFMKGVNLRIDDNVTVSVPDNKSTFESQKIKFKKEALRLRKIKNEHIVYVEDFFEENGTAYYVMEYIDGESLSEIISRRNTPMPEEQVQDILEQLLDALQTIHSATPHLYHLDIKPSNIMYDRQGKVRLIDFGASKQISVEEGAHLTLSTMCYTPEYSPTEQKEQSEAMIGPWTDFYALGGTLYKLLTQQLPPSNTTLINQGEKAFVYPTTVSDKMRQLIAWMMKPQLSSRPQSVYEIKQYLNGQESVPSEVTQLDTESTRMDNNISNAESSTNNLISKSSTNKQEKTNYSTNEKTNYDNNSKKKTTSISSHKWLFGVISILLMLLLGFAYLLFSNNQRQKHEQLEQFLTDSLAQAQKNEQARIVSINKVRESIEQARLDSIKQAKNDSILQVQQLEKERRNETINMVNAYSKKLDELVVDGYFLYDITHDGRPELWIVTGTCEADYQLNVFTYNHGIKRIFQIGASHSTFHQGANYILVWTQHMGHGEWGKISYNGKIKWENIYIEDVENGDCRKPKEPQIKMYKKNNKLPINNMLKTIK